MSLSGHVSGYEGPCQEPEAAKKHCVLRQRRQSDVEQTEKRYGRWNSKIDEPYPLRLPDPHGSDQPGRSEGRLRYSERLPEVTTPRWRTFIVSLLHRTH